MAMDVEFVTLGDAAKRIEVPAPTLRGWSDKLEELHVHYLERNHRDERIFYESDLKIFEFMRDAKSRYGRKTTTTDLAYVILENEDLECRQKGQVPEVPKHKMELSEIDMQHMLENPEFQSFMQQIIHKATDDISKELSAEISENVSREMAATIDDIEERRIKKLDQFMEEQRETRKLMHEYMNLPAYKKIFSKNPFKNK
ncbi:hypothetical protein [Virgibacillus salexigens]|uniref:Uncharacterized protein n=1 Tax=Virgibacillus massiliensis TaxID=1462526 RepID=A0A024QI48_9BACI|nr:hypothetical protein [Virgibacillus massiliensis]CDQ41865.1 hypothetical protein BN990_04244 [Virgibacillus massiliensis]